MPQPPPPPRPPPGEPRAAAVADQLHSAAIHLLRRVRLEDDGMGLTAPLASALSAIVFGGPLPIGALARAEQVRPPTISRVVAQLERRGPGTPQAGAPDRPGQRVRAPPRGPPPPPAGRPPPRAPPAALPPP